MAVTAPIAETVAHRHLGPIAYGALFVVLLPLGLVAWAQAAALAVALPLPGVPAWAAAALTAAGALVVAAAMLQLWRQGRGLPMNAYPPPLLVTGGLYAVLPHPIYTGFCAVIAGVALLLRSPAGFWLITPMTALGCAALVLGFEGPRLRARFGTPADELRLLAPDDHRQPSWRHRLQAFIGLVVPWLVLYELVLTLGAPLDAISTYLPFERAWPVLEQAELLYASVYAAVALAPLLAARNTDLRRFVVRGLLASAVGFTTMFALPLVAEPRAFTPGGPFGHLLALERTLDGAVGAFPSFHVIWALLAADVFARRWRRARWAFAAWAVLASLSCLAAGMHSLLDVAAGALTVALVSRAGSLWQVLRRAAEVVAGSWREWQLGPIRVINHGLWVGLGVLVGTLVADTVLGPGHAVAVLFTTAVSVVGAGLWAQVIEGSPRLSRPFGFYGGLLGIGAGSLAAGALGTDPWTLLAGFAVAGPFVQACGRMRCLVQGCCHGAPTSARVGIRYRHPRSRVCRLADLAGVPLHPTQLYSILWNGLTAVVMLRLWASQAAAGLVIGVFLLLNGAGRFVEEHYRGEPQTPTVAGLRLYQWLAVVSVAGGAVFTCLAPIALPAPEWSAATLPAALAGALLATVAMGVDFPGSNRRFSRLA